jgi:hypothetical protein
VKVLVRSHDGQRLFALKFRVTSVVFAPCIHSFLGTRLTGRRTIFTFNVHIDKMTLYLFFGAITDMVSNICPVSHTI